MHLFILVGGYDHASCACHRAHYLMTGCREICEVWLSSHGLSCPLLLDKSLALANALFKLHVPPVLPPAPGVSQNIAALGERHPVLLWVEMGGNFLTKLFFHLKMRIPQNRDLLWGRVGFDTTFSHPGWNFWVKARECPREEPGGLWHSRGV